MKHHESAQSAELEDVLTVLADQHCRDVLSYFRDSSANVASLDDIESHVREENHGPEWVDVRLHHVTLPRLDEDDYIDYDPRSKTVRYRRQPELERLLDTIHGR